MQKFAVIDLQPHLNAARDPADWHPSLADRLASAPAGKQTFWGVPFHLGPAEGASWVVPQEDVAVDLSGTAGYVVVAHFCDLSHDPEGKAPSPDLRPGEVTRIGERLADYVLAYTDGSEHRQPVRRRFEVCEGMVAWGHWAFAAVTHTAPVPIDFRGPHPAGGWGWNQTGVGYDGMSELFLWLYALENPHPEKELASLRLEPAGAGRLAVAGVTLYRGREHPLRHRRLESMRVTLPEPSLPGEVDVDVDLGVVARRYAVPAFDPESWLEGHPKGWGEEPLPQEPTDRLLLDVTAGPEATLRVGEREVELGPVYEEGQAQSEDGGVRLELLSPGKTWVHVTVTDDSTGKETPVRVHFRAPDGRYLPPYGHRHEVNDHWFEDYGADLKLGSTQYAYVDGRFQIELPVGEVYVEVSKGFEYRPVRRRLEIEAGQRELELHVERPLDWRSEGWVTADTHVHFISPQTAWLEAQCEGVNLVNLLASQWGDLFTNVGDLTGELSGASRDDTLIYVGTENRQHVLGHMSLLGGKGEPVYPMCAGGPNESYLGDPLWTSMAEWADRCRERDGVVVIPHFPSPYCEVAADLVLGKVDGVELRLFTPGMDGFGIREWYRYLNCGYRVAAVGGTDKMSAGMPVGGVRTYARLDGEFTFDSWAAAVRAGRTFTTSGPLIGLLVEGHSPGDEIRLPEGGGTQEIDVWVQSVQPFHELQLIINGQVVAEHDVEEGAQETRMHETLRIDKSAWIAARCVSRQQVWHCWPIHVAAHTSPVYVRCGNAQPFSPADATYMLTLIDGGLAWLDTFSIPADAERQARIRGVFEAARTHLRGRLMGHSHEHGHDHG